MASLPEGHKRNKSSALSLLRRSQTKDDDTVSESGSNGGVSFITQSTTAASPTTNPSTQQHAPSHGQLSRTSTGLSAITNAPASTRPAPANDKGPSIEQSVKKFRIFEALRSGDTAAISKAIREEAEPRSSTSTTVTSGGTSGLEDTTILHLAIQCAEVPVVEFVLSDGAGIIDVNARDKEGNTALHLAASQGRGPLVRLLLEQKGINDSIPNYQGRLPLDIARTPDIFQQLQLSRSIYVENKIKEIQALIAAGNYGVLGDVLEEPRVKTVLDINGGEFASDLATVQSGGTLLHEAARRKDIRLIEVLLLHGADPFRRDRKGRLPQDITKDDATRAMLKRSPAAIAAQRGIQEKAVLGNVNPHGGMAGASGDAVGGKDSREMKGYLKKWTNYRKGYQLRWFVLEDGVLSYYKHQDDMGSSCRGAINMKIAKLNMDPSEKQKFEIMGKSSVKYSLKANHEVEAKRWFWALNNSIQWTKDQAKEEMSQKARSAELLRQAKAEQSAKGLSKDESPSELVPESLSRSETRRNSQQSNRTAPQAGLKAQSQHVAFSNASAAGSIVDDEEGMAYGSYEPSFAGDIGRAPNNISASAVEGEDEEDEFVDDDSNREVPASKDAFDITAQSAKLQLDMMSQVQAALQSVQTQNPTLSISDSNVMQAMATYEGSIRNLKGLLGDLLKISKDRDADWQYRLDREADMRRLWEDSMAQVAREQEVLEMRVGESEEKRKRTKKALREVIESASRPDSRDDVGENKFVEALETIPLAPDGTALRRKSTALSSLRRKSILAEMTNISDSESDDEAEFFDAVDAGEVEVETITIPPPAVTEIPETIVSKEVVLADGIDISPSFLGYEDGIRKRLKMDADDRPKISLWGILKSMIGKDMTKMTLPVSFNEPTSLLQRGAEDMEYADLLDIAAARRDSAERMVYVTAFAASEYASTIGRVAKPFNPLLGETFEYARPDKKYRFFTEQVSHHPPIGAVWSESPSWTYYGEQVVKTKFYGKTFDIFHLGTWFVKLRPTDGSKEELYTWKKLTNSVIGIITGSPTIDNYGTMEVKNWTTGEKCIVDFKPRGWTVSSAYQLNGRVLDARGQPRFSIGGRWNNRIYARLTPGYEAAIEEPKTGRMHHRNSISDMNQVFLVWEANERPKGIPFNLTPFVVTLNDINDNLKPHLPPTDTRLRPDQRAMEDGEYDFAAKEKNRVEEKQRATRKRREASGEEFIPHWFTRAKHPVTGEEYWAFNGTYWEQREKAGKGDPDAWKGVEDIF